MRHLFNYYCLDATANDHGVKAQGDGWLLTIALVEAENLYSLDTDNSCDPYVVFTCNGKIRTSSVILGSCKPQWKGKNSLAILIVMCPI